MSTPSSVYLDPTAPAPLWAGLVALAIFVLAAFASTGGPGAGPQAPATARPPSAAS